MMNDTIKKQPALVTGGTGYIASWIVKYLLEGGQHVRISVRNKSNTQGYEHLLKIAAETNGILEVFEADLLREGSFKEAVAGCRIVYHTASPFKLLKYGNAMKNLITPAVKGTTQVLQAATEAGTVKKVVLTSSIAAMYGDAEEVVRFPEGKLTEEMWNTTSSVKHQPYSYAKTEAERAAWEIAKTQDKWELVVINPGFVMGPSLTSRIDSTSIDTMLAIVSGKYKSGVPDLRFVVADVRDVALAHFLAGSLPTASGRHIIGSAELSLPDIADILKDEYGKSLPLPTKALPNFMLYLVGPLMGFSWKYLRRNLSHPMPFSNERSRQNLGLKYTDFQKTILDHVEQLLKDGLVRMRS